MQYVTLVQSITVGVGNSERAHNSENCFKIFFAMNCNNKVNETYSFLTCTRTSVMNRHNGADEHLNYEYPI